MEKMPMGGEDNVVSFEAMKEARREQKQQKEWEKKTEELVSDLRTQNQIGNSVDQVNAKITTAFTGKAERIVDNLIEHFGATVDGYAKLEKEIARRQEELAEVQQGEKLGNEIKITKDIDALIQVRNAMQKKVEMEA